MNFTDKIVVISGAASGIGLALVQTLAKLGCKVFACDVDELGLRNLKQEGETQGYDICVETLDVSDEPKMRIYAQSIFEKEGRLDLWINNAGIQQMGRFADVSTEQFDRIMNINFRAVVNGSRIALEIMQQRGHGTIVNIASCAGHIPTPYMTAYTASKHAVVGFTRSLDTELRMDNSPVHTLLVSPGFVETKIIEKGAHLGFPEWLSFMLSSPETVAQSVVDGLKRKKTEVFPTLNGKLMLTMHRWAPKMTVKSSKVLLTKSLKDLVLNRYQLP